MARGEGWQELLPPAVARYLTERGGGAVVIGHDARHDSDLFANVSAQILSGAGLSVMMLPAHLPTPVLAFAVQHLGCAAGVMVTASHNPPQDNGYKVYLGDGSQIVPPADIEISAHIDAVAAEGPVAGLPHGDDWVTLDDDIVAAYVAKVAALVEPGPPIHLRLAYSAMHGVGGALFVRVLEEAGFPEPVVVDAQFDPDPDFPTVAFPNPEEPGAMDAALELAEQTSPDLVIANDPDADRCAVAIPVTEGGYRMLTGDEVGALLGWWILRRGELSGRSVTGTYATSIVSSQLLGTIARAAGLGFRETLTGFKWIARAADDLAFGYEEALGYCVDPAGVRDKDGISAGLLITELAATLRAEGRGMQDVLDDLARAHGLHATRQVSLRFADAGTLPALMRSLRADPPTALGGLAVAAVVDLESGSDGLPPTDGLTYWLAGAGGVDGARVIVRPSGTEPKIKAYLEVRVPVTAGVAEARSLAHDQLGEIASDVRSRLSR
jgi:phosphomannomutase